MSIHEDVNKALESIDTAGTPVRRDTYSGDLEKYITFFEYNEQDEEFSDDEADIQGHYVQVDVWSKGPADALVKEVKRLMKIAGFIYTNGEDMYEADTKLNHRGLRFNKPENLN